MNFDGRGEACLRSNLTLDLLHKYDESRKCVVSSAGASWAVEIFSFAQHKISRCPEGARVRACCPQARARGRNDTLARIMQEVYFRYEHKTARQVLVAGAPTRRPVMRFSIASTRN